MSIGVMGAGAFGTALAIVLSGTRGAVLWAREGTRAEAMRRSGENATRLPGVRLPDELVVTGDAGDLASCEVLLLCVPMQKLREFLRTHAPMLRDRTLVVCCKGMELGTGAGPQQIVAEECPEARSALLTGPSFALDIARGLPTALTLACEDPETAVHLQALLSTPVLRLYRTTDVTGAALGGAVKNVIAIAAGAAIGAGLGESARAALITRGNAEMQRLAAARGADPSTLSGLSGFGDLVLTCTSEQSRNYRFGLSIGAGTAFDPATTVEGAATARAVTARAKAEGLDLPISEMVAALVEKRLDVAEAMNALLSRSLKEE